MDHADLTALNVVKQMFSVSSRSGSCNLMQTKVTQALAGVGRNEKLSLL